MAPAGGALNSIVSYMSGQRMLQLAVPALLVALFTALGAICGIPWWFGAVVAAVALPVIGPLVTGGIGKSQAAVDATPPEIQPRVAMYLVLAMCAIGAAMLGAVWLLKWWL